MARRNKVSTSIRGARVQQRHGTTLGVVLERLESRAMLAGDLPPTLDALPNITIDEDSSEQTVFLQGISAGSGESQPLRVTATSSDTSLLPHPAVAYTSPKTFGVLTFTPVADASGTATVTVEVEDGGADGELATTADNGTFQRVFSVVVLAVNDLPVLDGSASPSLGAVIEDAAEPSGQVGVLVSSLVDAGGVLDNFTDADGDAPGIALTATNLEGGTLWYSTDDGGSWAQVGAVSETSPALLAADATTRLFYQPASGWTGTITDVMTFRGWDQKTLWTQVGSDLDGTAVADNAGKAVALSADGLTLAVGIPGHDGNGNNAGRVVVYHRESSGSPWVLRGTAIDAEAEGDAAGGAIALSSDGQILAIGAPLNDGSGRDAGHVRVFRWSEAAGWTQLGGDIDGEAAFDRSGSAVSLSGDGTTLAIGAFGNDEVDTDAGHARIYRWDAGQSLWVQQGDDIDGLDLADGAGAAVSLSHDGRIVAVGSPRHQASRGQVRTFQWNAGTTSWEPLAADLFGEEPDDNFGGTVALSGDGMTLAVGAVGNDAAGYGAGHVRVFTWNGGTAAWVQQGADLDGEAMFDDSAASVALSADGSTVVIGATGNDGNGENSGHVRVYRWDAGLAAWERVNADIDGEAANDSAGSAVAVSADGRVVAVGALGNSDSGSQAGHVRVFETASSLSAASDTVSVTVQRFNRQPTIDAVADLSISESAGEQVIELGGITAGDGDSQPIRVTAVSSDTTTVADPVVTYTSPEATGSLAFLPRVGAVGTVTITVTVEDGGQDNDLATASDNGSVTETFDITVTPDADPVIVDSVMTFTSNGLWLLSQNDGTKMVSSTFAAWSPAIDWGNLLVGDFNGDGLDDVVGQNLANGVWYASINQGDGTGSTRSMGIWAPRAGWRDVMVGDFNSDGIDDVVGRASSGAWYAAQGQADGSGFTNRFMTAWNPRAAWGTVRAGDFNGDGSADLAGRLTNNGQWWVAFTAPDGSAVNRLAGRWSPLVDWEDVMVGDFDGNGADDLVGRTSNSGAWYASLGSTSSATPFDVEFLGSWSPTIDWRYVTVVDINGDGRSDLFGQLNLPENPASPANGQWWAGQMRTDSLRFTNTLWGKWSQADWQQVTFGDFDDDGRVDVLGHRPASDSAEPNQWTIGKNGGSSLTSSAFGYYGQDAAGESLGTIGDVVKTFTMRSSSASGT
jgi:hypothetical protein